MIIALGVDQKEARGGGALCPSGTKEDILRTRNAVTATIEQLRCQDMNESLHIQGSRLALHKPHQGPVHQWRHHPCFLNVCRGVAYVTQMVFLALPSLLPPTHSALLYCL